MCVRLCCLSWLPLLLLIPGGCCSWSVVYTKQQVCAVRNTPVVFQCSFFYPGSYEVTEVKWARGKRDNFYYGPFIFDSKNTTNSSKFQYIGNKTHNCSLKIHQAEQTDAGEYAFRFKTNIKRGKYTGLDGPVLKVIDLKVLSLSGSGAVKEGDSLSLTCINECDGVMGSSSYTWFKNGRRFKDEPVLHFINVSLEDSGNYSCSLSEHKGTTSGELYINVEYGPRNTSVSVRPSMEVYSGTNFTLTCSSQANPTVERYDWFEVNGDRLLLKDENQPVFVSSFGGQFFCRASNKHGSQNSTVVRLTLKEHPPPSTTKIEVIIFTVVLLLVVVVFFFITWFKIKRSKRAAEENTQAAVNTVLPPASSTQCLHSTVYANWQATEGNNQPQTRNDCGGEAAPAELVYSTVVFSRGKMQQKRQQQEDPDCVDTIYTLVSK